MRDSLQVRNLTIQQFNVAKPLALHSIRLEPVKLLATAPQMRW